MPVGKVWRTLPLHIRFAISSKKEIHCSSVYPYHIYKNKYKVTIDLGSKGLKSDCGVII